MSVLTDAKLDLTSGDPSEGPWFVVAGGNPLRPTNYVPRPTNYTAGPPKILTSSAKRSVFERFISRIPPSSKTA